MLKQFDILYDIIALAPGKNLQIAKLFLSDLLYRIINLLPPIVTAGIIAILTDKGDFNHIWFYVVLYLVFYISSFAFLAWNYRILIDLSHHYYNAVQQKLFEHIVSNDNILRKIGRGKIADTCSEDISYISHTIDHISNATTSIIQLAIVFCIFAFNNIFAALFALAVDLLYFYLMNKNSRKVAKHYDGIRKYQDKIIDILNQMLGNLKQVKTLNLMPNLTKRIDRYRNGYDQQYSLRYNFLINRYCRIPILVHIGKISLYVFLAFLVFTDQIPLNKLVLLISYFETVIYSTDSILEQFLSVNNNKVRINRIKHILNYTNESSEADFGNVNNDYIDGLVTFDRVNYDLNRQPILRNITFKALPNEITAIVGRPGAGKTTIINLLYRLGHVKSGSILIDDESIYNYTKKVYTSNVSGVFQAPFTFKMSIRDNLSLVDHDLKNQIAAMKRVGIFKDIEKLPYGINTIIDDENPILTDGQIRKLSIARALLSKAEILLFDEVTSNIDPDSIKDVLAILKDLKEDHTVIIITHKAEIMKMADQVIVLKQGKIVAKGKNAEVFEKSALYRELRTKEYSEPSVNSDIIPLPNDTSGYINEPENLET